MRLRVLCLQLTDQNAHPGHAISQRILRAAALANIDKCYHHSVDFALNGAI
jgi:hypothetical protein